VGVALSLTFALGVAIVANAQWPSTPRLDVQSLLPILCGASLVFAVGLWDDVSAVPALRKLAVQVVAAAIAAGADILITRVTVWGATYDLGYAALALTIFWIVLITNAFNLMDGLDGLAGGLVVIAASTCAIVLIVRGEQSAALLLVALVGATCGFLAYNFHPARIFLGDSGSLLAGFLLAVTAIIGRQKGATTLALAVPLLIFALPLFETTLSICRRLLAGHAAGVPWRSPTRVIGRVFTADREHIHHRLVAFGLSHRGTVFALYAVSLAFSAIALLTMERP
jgi:UDP-GlcNAc:undecaprenyl-phosphate GlcNAc-1-phosphate transferase